MVTVMQNKIEQARINILSSKHHMISIPAKAYVLCSSPRCGTYMFAGIMKDMRLGDPYEAFNFGANRRYRPYYDVSDFCTLIDRVLEKQTSPETGVFGVKFFWEHLERFYRIANEIDGVSELNLGFKEMLELFFGSPHYIYLARRNLLKQAVSLAKAIQSNHFQTIDDSPDTVVEGKTSYDATLISQALMRILSETLLWENFFRQFDINPHRLWYEDLVNDRDKSIPGLLSFLKEHSEKIPEPHTKRLANKTNDDWYERYLEENRWLNTCCVDQLIETGEYVHVLARLSFYQSLRVGQKKGALYVNLKRLLNSLQWRLGKGSFG
jgi:trehalose 2-sulfotransferase